MIPATTCITSAIEPRVFVLVALQSWFSNPEESTAKQSIGRLFRKLYAPLQIRCADVLHLLADKTIFNPILLNHSPAAVSVSLLRPWTFAVAGHGCRHCQNIEAPPESTQCSEGHSSRHYECCAIDHRHKSRRGCSLRLLCAQAFSYYALTFPR